MQFSCIKTEDRPQERLLYRGPEELGMQELLALILRTGTREKSVVQLAEEVLAFAGTESGGLENICEAELEKVGGIGRSKACSIIAAVELGRRLRYRTSQPKKSILTRDDAEELLLSRLRDEKREHVILFLLNSRLEIESEHVISIGELQEAIIHPREVFRPAIRRSAASIIIAHNHPSGDPEPSHQDILVTKRLDEAGSLLGIRLLDHLIVGDGVCLSMRERGYFDRS